MDKKITWEEVATNKDKGWLVIEGVVYNPTSYLNDHPGGPAVLQNNFGKDATTQFSETGHTNNAREKLQQYKIGVIDQTSQPQQWQKGGGTPVQAKQFALLVVVFALAFAIWKILLK